MDTSPIPSIYHPSPYIELDVTAKILQLFSTPLTWIYNYAFNIKQDTRPEPPSAAGHFIIGSLPELIDHKWDLYQFLSHYQSAFGQKGFCKLKVGPKIFYVVSHPEIAKEILLKGKEFPRGESLRIWRKFSSDGLSEGEITTQFRNQAQQTIGEEHFKYFFPPIDKLSDIWVDRLRRISSNERPINLMEECERATLAALGESLFKRDAHNTEEINPFNLSHANAERCKEFLQAFHTLFDLICQRIASPLANIPKIGDQLYAWKYEEEEKAFEEAKSTLYHILKPIYTELLKNPETIDPSTHFYKLINIFKIDIFNPDYDQMLDTSVGFIQAAFETSSKGLGWTLLTLAQNPDVQQKLQAKLQAAFTDEMPKSYLELKEKVPYLLQVMEECLRLYPPFPMLLRDVVEPEKFKSYSVEKNGTFLISPLFIHRNKEFWGHDAEQFRPKRFKAEMLEDTWQRNHPEYLTFLGGIHRCPGRFFAKQELALLLVYFLMNFDIKQIPNAPQVDLKISVTLQPKLPIQVILIPVVN